jgi:hypothetical protein
MNMSNMLFESLVGHIYDFYGVDQNCFCIGVGGSRIAFEAVEDESDGYRSYFDSFKVSEIGKIFFRTPIAKISLREGGCSTRRRYSGDTDEYSKRELENSFNGWVLEDVETGHIWLTMGTDFGEDYYPCFTFRYEVPSKISEATIATET